VRIRIRFVRLSATLVVSKNNEIHKKKQPFLADRTNGRAIGTVLRLSVCDIMYRGPVRSLFAPRMNINILRAHVAGKQTFDRYSVIRNRTSQGLSVKSVQL